MSDVRAQRGGLQQGGLEQLYRRRLYPRQQAAGLDCVALVPGPNLRYLSGLPLFMSERPIVALYPLDGRPALVLPELERGRAAALTAGAVELYSYGDEEGHSPAFARAAEALSLDGKRVAVEHLHMRVLELRALEAGAPGASFVSLEKNLPGLRAIKDRDEIAALRAAIDLTEKALHTLIAESGIENTFVGRTERQIAEELTREFLRAGADAVAFMIVVAGPNGADPHAGPSDRPLQAGDLMTIDCGAVLDGYISDITRTFAIGQVSEELRTMYEVVRQANEAGRAAARPGIPAQEVDRAARKIIEEAGLGELFFHRTGHGLGLETHEPPYMVEGNEQLLEPGMVFTVEPGVYRAGLGGVRIEDDIVITEHGAKSLTTFPREWTVLS
jgi:Xaa-Pro dipeptidase